MLAGYSCKKSKGWLTPSAFVKNESIPLFEKYLLTTVRIYSF